MEKCRSIVKYDCELNASKANQIITMGTDFEKEAGSYILKSYGEFFKKQHHDLCTLTDNGLWNDNKTYLPIQVIMQPIEHISVTKLVSSDNTLITKVLGVLTSLCVEVVELKKEAFDRFVIDLKHIFCF